MAKRKVKVGEKRKEFARIIKMTPVQRGLEKLPVTLTEIAQYLDVHPVTISRWHGLLKSSGQVKAGNENVEPELEVDADDPELYTRPKEWLRKQLPVIFKSLVAECVRKGNPNAIKLVCELVDPEYKSKAEVTHFNGGYLTRLILEAERELNGSGEGLSDKGTDKVSQEFPFLLDEVRQDSG